MTPEALARQKIDALLSAAGWLVQDRAGINLGAAEQITDYLATTKIALGVIPTQKDIVVERFFTKMAAHT